MYLVPYQTSMMELFVRMVNDYQTLTIFGKMFYHRYLIWSYIGLFYLLKYISKDIRTISNVVVTSLFRDVVKDFVPVNL